MELNRLREMYEIPLNSSSVIAQDANSFHMICITIFFVYFEMFFFFKLLTIAGRAGHLG